jgi:hypothetical protein
MFAVTETVQVAAVSGFLVGTLPALVPAVLAWRSSRRTASAVGTPNGNGDVVQMLTQLLNGQAGQDRRLADLEHRMASVETTVRLATLPDIRTNPGG